jgi:transposase InsO family protein
VHGAAIHYIQPGKPGQNAYIERFNRTYRTEILNAHLFESVAELRALTDTWLRIYNSERPHDSLGRVPLFYRGLHQPASLSLQCLLDGEAYHSSTPSTIQRAATAISAA